MLIPNIRNHRLSFAILLFLILFTAIHLFKPAVIYMPDGSYRDFGLGYLNKTILPIWMIAILLGIFSYLAVSFYIQTRK
jgi:hypothetical protein